MTGIDRRRFLMGLGVLAAPGPVFAAGASSSPGTIGYAGARFDAAGASLAVFGDDGAEVASAPLPTRGHGLSRAPDGRTLVVIARRPGRWARAVSLDGLRVVADLVLPDRRHFYGHGCFSPDGSRFFTTENDFDSGEGLIGVWDPTRNWARIGERRSGGVGPHDIAVTADGRHLVIANGGIRTHPDSGRDILNRDEMRPNLALVSLERDEIVTMVDIGASLRLSSIRHLAVAPDGDVVFGCQYEGEDDAAPPLVGVWRPRSGEAPHLWDMPDTALSRLSDYVGSVALDRRAEIVAATSPRGGHTAFFERRTGRFLGLEGLTDVCGVAAAAEGFVVTSGAAGVRRVTVDGDGIRSATLGPSLAGRAWDNHLFRLGDGRSSSPLRSL